MKSIVIFPHQLYALSRVGHFYQQHPDAILCCVEEPLFFYDAQIRPFRIHKLKLAFHRAALRAYYDELCKKYGKKRVKYIAYDTLASKEDYGKAFGVPLKSSAKDAQGVIMTEPHDHQVKEKYSKIFGSLIQIHKDEVAFVMTTQDMEDFHKKQNKKGSNMQQSTFFGFVKKKLDVLVDVDSTDGQNRNPLPKDFKNAPEEKSLPVFDCPYHKEAKSYIEKHPRFSKHYGHIREPVWKNIAVTHTQAQKVLDSFIENRLHAFGKYQDAIHKDYTLLFHSHCAYLLNAGLLSPQDVLERVLAQQKRKNVNMNDVEGFVRQLLGWREYMRYIYVFFGPGSDAYTKTKTQNIFGSDRGIVKQKAWYSGELGVSVLDEEIRKVADSAYAHHIIRLMVFLNFMVLCRVHYDDIIQWFMEMVAIDAYMWVMWGNIIAMGYFDSRFMRKPYISTTNYLESMTRGYDISQETKNLWSDLFYSFLVDHKKEIREHAAFYTRNLSHWDKKSAKEQKAIQQRAHAFIDKYTCKK